MNRIFISFLFALALVSRAFAQDADPYTTHMTAAVTALDSLKNPADFAQTAAKFEMIAAMRPAEWLPNYYAAYSLATQSFFEKDAEKRDQLIARALDWWNKISVENDETCVLRAWIAQASMAVDGRNRWKTEGSIISEYLEKAKTLNPRNPRALLIEADGVFYKPKAFGGGAAKAKPLYEQTVAAYKDFVPASPLHPHWGSSQATRQLAACDK